MARKRSFLPWATLASNRDKLEDFSTRESLIAKREALRGNETESAVHDYAARRAKGAVRRIDRMREGVRAALKSTHIPGLVVAESISYHTARVPVAKPNEYVEEGRKIMQGSSGGTEP